MVDKNDDLEKGKKLIKEQATEIGFLDNAFKSLGATMAQAFEEAIEKLQGIDNIGAKIAKSYERDLVGSIKKITSSLEDNIVLQQKINKGQNVSKDIQERVDKMYASRELILAKINMAEGLAPKLKKDLIAKLDKQFKLEQDNLASLEEQKRTNVLVC